MPQDFFKKNTPNQAEEQIRALLAIRGFRYVRGAVLAVGLQTSFPDGFLKEMHQLLIMDYNDYLTGKYWSPIQAKPRKEWKESLAFSIQFRIFASAPIPPDTLIV